MSVEDVRDESLVRPDGRTVAWTRCGPDGGVPIIRMPGTPGSRWMVRTDRTPWVERGLQTIVTERPGFGRSTRLPGRGFVEHADDVAAVLDHLGVDRVFLTGTSGGSVHTLAFCARHPDRVRAATVISGVAPILDEELDQLIELNATGYRLARTRDRDGLRELLAEPFQAMSTDPLAGFAAVMAHAPASDQEIMADPLWQEAFARQIKEALAQGDDGWIDESIAMDTDWTDFDLDAITTSVTWWHATADKNTSWSAAQRLVKQLPNATMRHFGESGHFIAYRREAEILDELLSRDAAA